MNVNIGGTKHWNKVPVSTRKKWKILDIAGTPDYRYDLNSGLFFPFRDDQIENYYCSHTLEHIKIDIILHVLSEIRRTLVSGGKIRVVVPDVQLAVQRYVAGDIKWLKSKQSNISLQRNSHPDTALGYLMLWFYSIPKGTTRSGHNLVFDKKSLQWYFERSGFKEIKFLSYKNCTKVFEGMDFPRHRGTSIYMEAAK